MSRGEAWRGVVTPRHWVLALIVAAVGIVLPGVLFRSEQPEDVFGRAMTLLMTLVFVNLDSFGNSWPFAVPTTVTLTDTTLTVVRPSGTKVVPWPEVTSFRARRRHWLVHVERERTVALIPMRVFDADQRAAIELLAKQVRRDRRGRTRRSESASP
ncbi:PH domain-containing protein [Catenulispora subtropica]